MYVHIYIYIYRDVGRDKFSREIGRTIRTSTAAAVDGAGAQGAEHHRAPVLLLLLLLLLIIITIIPFLVMCVMVPRGIVQVDACMCVYCIHISALQMITANNVDQ